MKQFARRVRQTRRAFFDSRVIVAIIGILLSIILHEVFHVLLHWGSIVEVNLFTSHGAIMEIISRTAPGYNAQLEEVGAYTITLITILCTAFVISKMHDKKDTRSFTQTVFPKNKAMQHLSPQELFELAARVNLL